MVMKRFVLKQKPVAVILCLKEAQEQWYPSKLAKYSGCSYVYVTGWLAELEKAGWVKFEKKGRLKSVSLTEQGRVIASLLDELVKKMQTEKKPEEKKVDAEGRN